MARTSVRRNQSGMAFVGSLVNLLAGLLITVLVLRLIFRLLGANPDNGFVTWVYGASQPFVTPFFGMFNHTIDVFTGRLEIETVVAIIVYGVIASVLARIFSWPYDRRSI